MGNKFKVGDRVFIKGTINEDDVVVEVHNDCVRLKEGGWMSYHFCEFLSKRFDLYDIIHDNPK